MSDKMTRLNQVLKVTGLEVTFANGWFVVLDTTQPSGQKAQAFCSDINEAIWFVVDAYHAIRNRLTVNDSPTEPIVVVKEADAQNLAGHLVWLSTPFSVEPLPDDAYRFTVNTEIADRLREFCRKGKIKLSPCDCNCHCGGWDGAGTCKKPCEKCDCEE